MGLNGYRGPEVLACDDGDVNRAGSGQMLELLDAQTGADPCPSVLALGLARDGLLARIRVPGGTLAAAQLSAIADIAERCGNGQIDITARANLQLRGIRADAAEFLAQALQAAGLLPSRSHERVRNILASPLAGLDPAELVDTRPLVEALDAELQADPLLAELPAKFGFGLDGGGVPVDFSGHDIVLQAFAAPDAVRFAVILGRVATGLAVPRERAVAAALLAARRFLALTDGLDPARRRMRDLIELRGTQHFRDVLTAEMAATPAVLPARPRASAVVPLGIFPIRGRDRVAIAPIVPLGRLSPVQARGLAEIARRFGGDLRLTPWRGVIIGPIPAVELAFAAAALVTLDLPVGDDRGFAGLHACAGIEGCGAALADVRSDATILARRVARARKSGHARIFFAGCAKRCGMRGGADYTAVATPDGYEVEAGDVVIGSSLSGPDAVGLIARRLDNRVEAAG